MYQGTIIGQINREIEQHITSLVEGSPGAVGRAIETARKRELFLRSKTIIEKKESI